MQRQALDAVGIAPPQIPLTMIDLAATRWIDQPDLDWIMLIGSLAVGHTDTVVRPVEPQHDVHFTLLWDPTRSRAAAVDRVVHHALSTSPPPGWKPGTAHLRYSQESVEPPS